MTQYYSHGQENIDQQIGISNTGEIYIDSIHFGDGDYVQILQCFSNFKSNSSNDNPDNYDWSDEIAELQNDIDRLGTQIYNLQQKLEEDERDFENDIGDLQDSISQINSKLELINSWISGLLNNDVNLQTDINNIKSQIDDLQDQINNIQHRIDTNEDNVIDLTEKLGQLNAEVSQLTNPNQISRAHQGLLTAAEVHTLAINKSKQFAFKFDKEAVPQDVVDSLEADEDFMKWFLPMWDDSKKCFIIMARKTLPDNSLITFRASGDIANALGLSETRYMLVNYTNPEVVYNRYINYPYLDQTITLTVNNYDSTVGYNYITTKTIQLQGYYRYNQLRNEFVSLTSHSNDQYEFALEFMSKNGDPTKMVLVLIVKNNNGNSASFKYTLATTAQTNILQLKTCQEQTFTEQTNNYKVIELSEVFDLTASDCPFKPDSNLVYRPQNVEDFINNSNNQTLINNILTNPPQCDCQLQFNDITNDQQIQFNIPSNYSLDDIITDWNAGDLGQYYTAAKDTTKTGFYAISFTPTNKLKSIAYKWTNGVNYKQWFDQFNITNNYELKLSLINNAASPCTQQSNYKKFNYNSIPELTIYDGTNTTAEVIYTTSLTQNIDAHVLEANTQGYTIQSTDLIPFNHNDFRRVWCYQDFDENGEGFEYNFNYTTNRWYIKIVVPGSTVWTFKLSTNSIGGICSLVSDTLTISSGQNIITLTNSETIAQEYVLYSNQQFYLPDTNNLDTHQHYNNTTLWNQVISNFAQDVGLQFRDVITNTTITYNMEYNLHIWQMADDMRQKLGNYFPYIEVQDQSTYYWIILSYYIYGNSNQNIEAGDTFIIEWQNQEHTSQWLNWGNYQYVGYSEYFYPITIRNRQDQYQQNLLVFDETEFWDQQDDTTDEGNVQELTQLTTAINNQHIPNIQQFIQNLQQKLSVKQSQLTAIANQPQYLYLWCDDVKATYSMNLAKYDNDTHQTTSEKINRNGLLAIISQNDYQPCQKMLYKISGNAQPIKFKLTTDIQGYNKYQDNVALQVQFIKKQLVEGQ